MSLSNCYLEFWKLWELWKLWKNKPQKCFQKMGKLFFNNFQNTRIYVHEPYQVYMCTKFLVTIFKNDLILMFWRSKNAIFTLFLAISVFSWFSKFVRFGPLSKCPRVIFLVLYEKLTQEHVSRCPKTKFSVWSSLDLVTLNELDLECAHQKLRMVLRCVQDTIFVVVLTCFHFIRL